MVNLRVIAESDLTPQDRARLFGRKQSLDEISPRVQTILEAVRAGGDDAVRRFTEQFDGARLDGLEVTAEEFESARLALDPGVVGALEAEIQAVRAFHRPQRRPEEEVETVPGVRAWREWRPIERVGLYVPGGRGAYPSSVVMLGVPASIAGCPEIVLCTPPAGDSKVPAATLVAAELVGIHRVFKIGGAQAIAAMAHGTQSVPAVDKIFGAGNAYVTAAKLLVFPTCSIDSPAGPSELVVLADGGANPAWIAADLLSDAEHGPDSPAVLITTSFRLAHDVAEEIEKQLESLPRADIARQALQGHGLAIVARDEESAISLANEYAPEHLEIVVSNPQAVLARVRHAGSVFLGPYAPNAAGDYATGTNHVLPTARYSRMFSAASVESFGRSMQVQELDRGGLERLRPVITRLARAEGLEGHARAAEIRFAPSPPLP